MFLVNNPQLSDFCKAYEDWKEPQNIAEQVDLKDIIYFRTTKDILTCFKSSTKPFPISFCKSQKINHLSRWFSKKFMNVVKNKIKEA